MEKRFRKRPGKRKRARGEIRESRGAREPLRPGRDAAGDRARDHVGDAADPEALVLVPWPDFCRRRHPLRVFCPPIKVKRRAVHRTARSPMLDFRRMKAWIATILLA